MSRQPARFTEADAVRAARAAKRAGMIVKIDREGTIWIVPDANSPQALPEPNNEQEEEIVL